MILILMLLWIMSICFILIFFYGATRKEKEMEYKNRLLAHEKEKN